MKGGAKMEAKGKAIIMVVAAIAALVLSFLGVVVDAAQSTLGNGAYFSLIATLILSIVVGLGLNILKK